MFPTLLCSLCMLCGESPLARSDIALAGGRIVTPLDPSYGMVRWELTGERPYPTVPGEPGRYSSQLQIGGGWPGAH
jgi:hypothetical protein